MSNTIFIALQCYQCSIMQVKQKKKSSNKWTCVVCNQKQSVRKVFAQGYMAKDLRQFVQSFNMSLKDQGRQQEEEEEEEEEEVLETEVPNKKQKLNNHPCSSGEEGYHQFYKPSLSSQAQVGDMEGKESQQSRARVDSKWRDYLTEEDEEEPRTNQPKMTTAASKWKDYKTQDDMKNPRSSKASKGEAASKWSESLTDDEQEQRIHRPPKEKAASKWKTFLTQEDNDLQYSLGAGDQKAEWRNGVFETQTHDQQVEDDIHPDFI